MGVFNKIGEFFGGGAMSVVEKGADIVERWAPSAEKKHEMAREIDDQIAKATGGARSHDQAIGKVGNWFDSFVNGINRLIRPAVTIWLCLGLGGVVALPQIDTVDPLVLGWIEIVLVFWFGGRVLLKDLPAAISYLKHMRSKP